jgi:hypothetical protein
MPSGRTNLTRMNLSLDEQSFQGLLSAAFTIQEHNDRRKQARQTEAEPGAHREAEGNSLCPHCGSPKPAETPRCQSCGLDVFRPGERMQRNWASMWLMSQEQGQGRWLERPDEVNNGNEHEVARRDSPPVQAKPRPNLQASTKVASNGFLKVPEKAKNVVKEVIKKTNGAEEPAVVRQQPAQSATNHPAFEPSLDDHFNNNNDARLDDAPPKRKWPIKAATDLPETLTAGNSDLIIEPPKLSASHDSHSGSSHSRASDSLEVFPADLGSENAYAIEATSATIGSEDNRPTSLLQRFVDLRVTLRFHRADLYLGIAVFVAIAALLWPAAVSPQRATLSLWERALVAAGIAEAPAPAVLFQGDPGTEVWVDTHTGLYYCPGEDPYGKTADGRLSSQREAQMDRFQPANRSACE